jgi:hypothetical protein
MSRVRLARSTTFAFESALGPVLAQILCDLERGHECHVAGEHHLDRLVVQEVAVLDAVHAGSQSGLDAGGPDRMRGDPAARAVRLARGSPHLLFGQLLPAGLPDELAGPTADPGRGHDLDPVGSGPKLRRAAARASSAPLM